MSPEPIAEEAVETAPQEEGVRFSDAWWDDAFCAWWDPSLRVCC